jgi:hypothetical protein
VLTFLMARLNLLGDFVKPCRPRGLDLAIAGETKEKKEIIRCPVYLLAIFICSFVIRCRWLDVSIHRKER